MGKSEKDSGFRIEISPRALKELRSLDKTTLRRIASRIEWIASNAARIVHQRLLNMPKYLRGLCKRREGDYRILYWPDFRKKVIKIYSVIHRREDYKSIR